MTDQASILRTGRVCEMTRRRATLALALSMVGVAVVLAWPSSARAAGDLGGGGMQYLSRDGMLRVTGGETHNDTKCGLYTSQKIIPCGDATLCCSKTEDNHCHNKEPNGYWTCQTFAKFQCMDGFAWPCYRQRLCGTDDGQCNYGKPDWRDWWCYQAGATCGNFYGGGQLPASACSFMLLDLP
jgi:hypothetical protein